MNHQVVIVVVRAAKCTVGQDEYEKPLSSECYLSFVDFIIEGIHDVALIPLFNIRQVRMECNAPKYLLSFRTAVDTFMTTELLTVSWGKTFPFERESVCESGSTWRV